MKLAYADPPYFGYGKFYDEHHPESRVWDHIEPHRDLVNRLCTEFSDGWAMSLTSGNLHDILPLCPHDARVAAWVKPFASFKKNVSPAYTWEPVIFMRTRKHDVTKPTVRDFLAQGITLKRGLIGAKPEKFCSWVLDLIGWQPGDEVEDVFPGTGVMGRVVAAREFEAGNALELVGAPALFNEEPNHTNGSQA